MPDEFVRKAEREYVRALTMVEGRVEGCGDKTLTNVQAVHVKGRGSEGGEAGIAIFRCMDPTRIAAKNMVRRVGIKAGAAKEAKFTRDARGGLYKEEGVRRVQTVGESVGVTGEERTWLGGEGVE